MPNVSENRRLLANAVVRNAAVVLSLPSVGLIRNHRTRFLGETEEGFWIEFSPESSALIKELKDLNLPLAVSFNSGIRRISFASSVLRIEEAFSINAQSAVAAVLVFKPSDIICDQRRSAYRVMVPQDCDLRARAWVIPEHAYLPDQPSATLELKLEIQNISTGGLGVRLLPNPSRPISLAEDQRLRIELKYSDLELILDGRLRGEVKPGAKSKSSGIVFKKLDRDLEGRQKLSALTRIIGELQCAEVRRTRRAATG